MNSLLYNELADAGEGKANAEKVIAELREKGLSIDEELSLIGLDLPKFFGGKKEGDRVIIFGGDGTLNHFINDIGDCVIPCQVDLYPTGTGNDFARDLPEEEKDPTYGTFQINKYIVGLPIVEVKGKKYRFINGIGYGIDGECCRKADDMKAAGEKDLDYGSITIGLLMKEFKAPNATVVVDGGEPMHIKKAYLASAMNGRYYGGGMNIAPEQKRCSGILSFVCIHGRGRIGTLLLFPKLFKGTHVKAKKACYIQQGKTIEVSFDAPCALQIDGETVRDVLSYKAYIA